METIRTAAVEDLLDGALLRDLAEWHHEHAVMLRSCETKR